jgi:hypothetical protein
MTNKKTSTTNLLAVVSLFLLNLSANGWPQMKTLSMDDFATVMRYNSLKPMEFIFNTANEKFRPIYNILVFVCSKVFGDHYTGYDTVNLMLTFCLSVYIFYIALHISKKQTLLSLCLSAAFLMSRLAFFQLTQVYGIMEAAAMFFALTILFCLYRYINEENSSKNYYLACIMYILISFTHERYMALFPLLIIAVFMNRKNNKHNVVLALIPAVLFCAAMAIRILMLGNHVLEGTLETSIIDSFSVKTVVKTILSQILYLLGVNAGASYLNGINYADVPATVYILDLVYIVCILAMISLFVVLFFKDKPYRARFLRNSSLFICFIVLCIISSSITVRLETRWVYVSLVGMLLFLAYMLSELIQSSIRIVNNKSVIAVVLVFLLAFIPMELFFRNHWDTIYLVRDRSYNTSLYDETIGRYGDDLSDKKLIIVNNTDKSIKIELVEMLFLQFLSMPEFDALQITIVDAVSDITDGDLHNGSIILAQDQLNERYVNITALFVRR